MLKKNNLQSPKIFLEELKSPLITKRVINTKEKILDIKPLALPYSHNIVEPFIFKKNKSPIKTISFINNDTGKMRHFTPAAQEWYNSIYSYNKNYIKLLPSADKNVMKLLKSYFNLFVDHKILKTKRIANRYRKLSANKVFVGKGELKHTNNKVIITSYVYNVEQLYIKSLAGKEAKSLYYPNKKLKIVNMYSVDKKTKYNRPYTLDEYFNSYRFDHYKLHSELSFKLFWKQYVKLIGMKKLKNEEKKDKEKEKLFKKNYGGKEANIFLESIAYKSSYSRGISIFKDLLPKDLIGRIYNDVIYTIKQINQDNDNDVSTPLEKLYFKEFKLKDQIQILFIRNFHDISISNNNTFEITYQKFLNSLLELVEEKNQEKLDQFKKKVLLIRNFYAKFDLYMAIAEKTYLKKFTRFAYLLMINTVKYKTPFVSKLVYFLKNVYKKNVELNIVNLNKMHLNSDIYTQIVSLKLKNRNNKLFRVLRWSLNKVKLPNVSRMTERLNISNRDDYLINKIRNTYINSMFNNIDTDPLNNLLLRFFSSIDNLEINIKKKSSITKRSISLYKYIVRSLKHIKLAGIRVEAKGRLTRRFTASRSVFNMRWKGGLKNVDSSFKGLSAIMLRGDRKSNVEYSMLSSKNRNGAYGVKGWVSSK